MAEGGSSSAAAVAAAAVAAAAAMAEEEERGRLRAVDAVRDFMPFMLQVVVVALFTWLVLPVTFNGFIVFCCLCAYLLEVEKRGRKRQRSEIATEERRNLNTKQTFAEGETARWLNEGIRRMWPVSMQKFASKHFFGPMAPYFLDKFKPSWIVKEAKMDVEALHLGNQAPVFNYIRAIEIPPDGDHLAYEADMNFHAGSDMTAQISVLTRAGVGATFYISNLHIEGKVRMSVKFLPGWPVVERVRICFASIPQVTMSYRPYYKTFFDASLMPMVANLVMKTLDNAMVQSIVQPNMLEVDVEALAKMLSPESQGAPAKSFSWPVESKPTLVVEILEAANLTVADRNGSSDPYVEVQLGRQKLKKTKVIKRTLFPKWKDEQHQFSIDSWDMPNLLTLRVRDSDLVPYRASYELGILDVPLNDLYKDPRKKFDDEGKPYEFGKRYEFFQKLDKVKRGRLRFAITVNSHTHPPQAAAAPCEEQGTTSDPTACQTQTQEIKSAVDVVASDWAGTSSVPRSKSDTNLKRLDTTPPKLPRPKGKSKVGQDPPPPLEALQEQAPTVGDETHDFITMPYGPPGAFSIFHPGSMTPRPGKEKAELEVKAEPEVKATSSRRRNRVLRLGKKKKPSQESVLSETLSEQSGSVDFSGELKSLAAMTEEAYHGPIRMDLINDPVAAEEPPEMRIHRPQQALSPIVSGKTSSSVPAPPISQPTLKDVTDEDETTTSQPLVNQTASPPPAATQDDHAMTAEPSQRQGKSVIFGLPKIWYQKAKALATKGRKSKKKVPNDRTVENGDAVYLGDVDPTVSRTESFDAPLALSPLDLYGTGAPDGTEGDSAELRKIVHETRESRAAGSQSDRPNRAAKVKRWIKDQSKSFRHESRPKLLTPLNPIPETRRRNGKV